MRKLKLYIQFIIVNAPILFQILKQRSIVLYRRLKLDYLALIFLHKYSAHTFNPLHLRNNVLVLHRKKRSDWLHCNREGRLELVTTRSQKFWLFIQDGIFFGAFSSRIKRVVYLNLMTLTLELRNPFNRALLKVYLERKIAYVKRIMKKVEWVNGKLYDQSKVHANIEIFLRNSIIQGEMIKEMHMAVKRQKEPQIVKDGREGLASGLFPILIEKGRSGSYWIRSKEREVLGLFKPFDEETFAPHNPAGAGNQGALGIRRMRRGTRVGESAHNEVAAFLVDEHFGFGIVPKTCYASFTHHAFFLATENSRMMLGSEKTKYGSFQEFVEGFVLIGILHEDEVPLIPVDEFQIMVILDVIIGNSDRHFGNLLIGDQKIAAIDHGYTFPDVVTPVMTNVWKYLDIGRQPFHPAIVKLIQNFPLDEIGWKLRRRCFRSLNVIERMRERVALLRAALNAELTPQQMAPLWEMEYLELLYGLNSTLDAKAREVVELYLPTMGEKLTKSFMERWLE